ncbi:MAG: tRNA dihydrouridine synthase DusB [Clostridia bacterium]|nr:tRNA dihydrouridine synthase DusB [Clostridia bacterium]
MSLTIGTAVLPHGLMLAPMAGVTDRSFRLLCRAHGAEYLVSEMVSAKALCYEQKAKRREAALMGTAPLAAISAKEAPMAIQIFGSEPDFMAEAARMLEASSYRGCLSEIPPVAIDVNMGCPVRKITGNGEGSALMKNPRLAGEIVAAMTKAVKLPVTVKIRAGWDSDSINAPEMAKILEQSGAALICVHARTKEQLYTPGIDLSVIERVKRSVSIPVIGNGDISSAEDALTMMEKTGCDGVMVGRGAMGNPWLFEEISARMEGRDFVAPTVEKRIETALLQLEEMIKHKGARVGLAEGKKHVSWYLNGLRGAASARAAIMTADSPEAIGAVLKSVLNENEKI